MFEKLKGLRRFKLKGCRPCMRTVKELAVIDKAAADEAFKKYKKEILEAYLISKGFIKYKSRAYVRKSKIDVLEYIDIQRENYGSRTFTVNYSIMPLYVYLEVLVFGFGGRLGKIICDKNVWWDFADAKIAEVSFLNVTEALDRFVLPWFEKHSDEEIIIKELLEEKERKEKRGWGLSKVNAAWLKALEEGATDRPEIIAENIENQKLPKKLLE